MLSFIRSFFKSKIGIFVSLAFLGLIAFAFASGDTANNSTFGGIAGGSRVAVVGDETVTTSDLQTAVNSAYDSVRQNNPTLSMPAFIGQGGFDEVLKQLLERISLTVFSEDLGLRAGENLVNSEIIKIPAFRGADGNFDQQTYQAALSQQGLNDAMMRKDLASGMLAQQLLVPAAFGAKMPEKIAIQYAALLKERREGEIGLVLSSAYAPTSAPTDAQLNAYYSENNSNYIRPERRIIRYATFGDEALKNIPAPTAKEVAAFYEANRNNFEASETRSIAQIIVPTQQGAAAMRKRIDAGESIDKIAGEAGLNVVKIDAINRETFASQTSNAVATAIFTANKGSTAAPARSGLGFHVAVINDVKKSAGQTLEQAKGEITTGLTEQKRRQAISDLAASTEELIGEGSLNETAKKLGLEIKTTQPITGAGQVYNKPGEKAPDILAPAVQSAFEMEESEPQLTEIEPGKTFLIFEVSKITSSTAAPLAEIKDQVVDAWKLEQGSNDAKKAADRVIEKVNGGMSFAEAMKQEKKELPPVDSIDLSREQLAQQGQRVPAPLALMFSMAEGTTKKLAAPQNAGWFIIGLDKVETGTVAKDDPILAGTRQELSTQLGREYADQLRFAVGEDVSVERNDSSIEAVRKQLSGEN